MAETITIDVTGIPEAIANIKWYQIVKQQAIKDILLEHGFKIESYAKELVPVDTGRLRASISTNWSGSGRGEGRTDSKAEPGDGVGQPQGKPGMTVVVGSNVSYAPFQEHGTKRMKPRPYLHPAYFMYEGEVVKRVGKVLKDTKK